MALLRLALLAIGAVRMVSGPWYPDRGIGTRGMVIKGMVNMGGHISMAAY